MHSALIPMDDVEDFVVLQARAFGQKVQNAVLRDALAHEDLPVLEWQLLFSVARFGSCHLAHITSRTSIDPAHGSRAAAALETKGLIERRSDPDNRRRKLISLTPEGVRTFDRIWPQAKRIVQSVTDQFSEDEFRVFKCLLAKANMAADKLAVTETVDAEKTGAQEDNRLRV